MNEVLLHMKRLYGVRDFDWMKFRITHDNPLTYHHIKKEANGGKKNVYNGALLTKLAQTYLHQIEVDAPEIYYELNKVFLKLNGTRRPITKKESDIIEGLLLEYETKCNKLLRKRIKFERINASALKDISPAKELFSPTNIRRVMQKGIDPKKLGQKHRIMERKGKKGKKR